MKILHIVGDSKFGGGSIVILRLSQKAKELGWDVDVLTTDEKFIKVLLDNGIGVINLNVIWREINPIRDLYGLYKLFKFLRRSDYEIVHTHTSKAGFVGRLAAKMAGIPIIIHTVHGFAFHEESRPLILWFYASLERIASHWCDKIVTVSEFHREWALKLGIGNEEKVVAIPNGIPAERVFPTQDIYKMREKLGLTTEKVILSTGRLALQKGYEYLIRAIPIIMSKTNKSFKVLIVGEGPLRSYLENLTKTLGVEKQVKFLGFRSDIGDLLNVSDVVVLPSLWEGLSISLLEAMAAGKPIVTTNIGSNEEVLENNISGILVPSKNPEALSEAIIKVMDDPVFARKIGEKAKSVYQKYYTEDNMVNKYIDLYQSLYRRLEV